MPNDYDYLPSTYRQMHLLHSSRVGNNRKIPIFRCNKPMQWCAAKNANSVLTGANKSSPFVGGRGAVDRVIDGLSNRKMFTAAVTELSLTDHLTRESFTSSDGFCCRHRSFAETF